MCLGFQINHIESKRVEVSISGMDDRVKIRVDRL